ncbi:MAG: hypothetical protein KAQ87_00250 [Candidatus Pacebacteria bacterium]|nr:hypothetical protein [Candidatus Paceibacterota bacterium]
MNNKKFLDMLDVSKKTTLTREGKLEYVYERYGTPHHSFRIMEWSEEIAAEEITSDLKREGLEGILGDFIYLESQNLSAFALPENVVIRLSDDDCGIVTRGDSLMIFYLLLKAKWVFGEGRGGIFETSDGQKFLVGGSKGDPYTTSSMSFSPLSDEEVDDYINRKEEEKRAEKAALEEAQKIREEEREKEYLQYRSSIRGLTEALGLSILERKNIATSMPPAYMVCKNVEDFSNDEYQMSFELVASFCSPEGPYAFLRSIVKYVRQTNDGQISRKAWDSLNLDDALNFAHKERERYEEKMDR